MDDQITLEHNTKIGIIKDLESLGVIMTRQMADAVSGRLSLALAMSYQQGWRAALLRVSADFTHDKTAVPVTS